MGLFLTILKIIGIILLSVLGLLFIILLLLLFWPFQYRIAGQKKEELNGYVTISWLFHILCVKVFYKNDFNIILRIFGIPIYNHKKKQNKDALFSKMKSEDALDKANKEDLHYTNEDTLKNVNEDALKNVNEDDLNNGSDAFEKESGNEGKDDGDDAEKSSHSSKINRIIQKIKEIIVKVIRFLEKIPETLESLSDTITDKIEKALDTYDYYDRLFMQNGTEYAIDFLKKKIIKILKHLKPFYCKIIVDYVSEDPSTIGKLMEYYSMAIPFLLKKIEFRPVFREAAEQGENQPALQIDAKIKGRFVLGYLGINALQVLLNKRVKTFYKRLKREGV
ncbi:MAG: hypothetical protein ACI4DU_05765 [Lachnospiraceae bacterium]